MDDEAFAMSLRACDSIEALLAAWLAGSADRHLRLPTSLAAPAIAALRAAKAADRPVVAVMGKCSCKNQCAFQEAPPGMAERWAMKIAGRSLELLDQLQLYANPFFFGTVRCASVAVNTMSSYPSFRW